MAFPFHNMLDVPALAWSDHSGTPVTVEPNDRVPEGTTMLTVRLVNRHVLVWSSRQDIYIIHATDNDVLGGRGRHSIGHQGNIWFTQFADQFKTRYHVGSAAEKANIILNDILAPMNLQGRRFLKLDLQDPQRNIWVWALDPNPRVKIGAKLRDMNKASVLAEGGAQPLAAMLVHHYVLDPVDPPEHPEAQPLALFEDAMVRDEILE